MRGVSTRLGIARCPEGLGANAVEDVVAALEGVGRAKVCPERTRRAPPANERREGRPDAR